MYVSHPERGKMAFYLVLRKEQKRRKKERKKERKKMTVSYSLLHKRKKGIFFFSLFHFQKREGKWELCSSNNIMF